MVIDGDCNFTAALCWQPCYCGSSLYSSLVFSFNWCSEWVIKHVSYTQRRPHEHIFLLSPVSAIIALFLPQLSAPLLLRSSLPFCAHVSVTLHSRQLSLSHSCSCSFLLPRTILFIRLLCLYLFIKAFWFMEGVTKKQILTSGPLQDLCVQTHKAETCWSAHTHAHTLHTHTHAHTHTHTHSYKMVQIGLQFTHTRRISPTCSVHIFIYCHDDDQ